MHGAFKLLIPSQRRREALQCGRWAAWVGLCLTRRRERRALRELDDDQLKDIGLSRADVERECRRWPWEGGARAR